MFGKHFASTYTGSLFGRPAIVFAVWGYVIACMRPSRKDGDCYIEINPTLLAATFATTVAEIMDALAVLASPDPASRSKADDGRRLVRLDEHDHVGPSLYRVVNGATYRAMRDEEERRTYLREAKRRERAGGKRVNNVNNGQPASTQAEVEVEAEVEAKRKSLVDWAAEAFEVRWAQYPRKDGKREALRHFRATVTDDIQLARFDRSLSNYLKKIETEKIAPKFIKNGSSFVANWEDFVDWKAPSPVSSGRSGESRPTGADFGLRTAVEVLANLRADEIREHARLLEAELALGDAWRRIDCTRDQAAAYMHHLRGAFDGDLGSAPTLSEFIAKGAA